MSPSPFSDARAGHARLVTVPGLHGSGAEHWQTWLERQFPGAARVEQDDWHVPDLEAWAARLVETLATLGDGPHVLVAHSFGCLATLHLLQRAGQGAHATVTQVSPDAARTVARISQVLLVAPAEPARFGVVDRLPQGRLDTPACLVASDSDPWMSAPSARAWALRWGSDWINLGDAGHINISSGFGPFPLARDWTFGALRRLARAEVGAGFDAASWSVAA
jgi:predicted alpha/beta hydrolase family esterase